MKQKRKLVGPAVSRQALLRAERAACETERELREEEEEDGKQKGTEMKQQQ